MFLDISMFHFNETETTNMTKTINYQTSLIFRFDLEHKQRTTYLRKHMCERATYHNIDVV